MPSPTTGTSRRTFIVGPKVVSVQCGTAPFGYCNTKLKYSRLVNIWVALPRSEHSDGTSIRQCDNQNFNPWKPDWELICRVHGAAEKLSNDLRAKIVTKIK